MPEVANGPLDTAIETLQRKHLLQARDELLPASEARRLTRDGRASRARDLLAKASQLRTGGKEPAAQEAVLSAFQLDPAVKLPQSVQNIGDLYMKATEAPPEPFPDESTPPFEVLRWTVDLLYRHQRIFSAGVVLELAQPLGSTSPLERAQALVRQGILLLRMKQWDDDEQRNGADAKARTAFQGALDADPGVSLPSYAPGEAVQAFNDVKAKRKSAVTTTTTGGPVNNQVVITPPVTTGPVTGGGSVERDLRPPLIGLGVAVLGGLGARGVAYSFYQAEVKAAEDGENAAFESYRNDSKTALNVSYVAYGVGAACLVWTGVLFLWPRDKAPDTPSVTAGAGPGGASLSIGGRF